MEPGGTGTGRRCGCPPTRAGGAHPAPPARRHRDRQQRPVASAQRLAGELPDSAEIFPTHGFGTFRAATRAQAPSSTIGKDKRANPALTLDEPRYVETLLTGLDTWPAYYYAHAGPANAAGPGEPDLTPPRRADAAEVRRRIEAGEWAADLRDRVAFASGFVPGSFSFALDGSFATYLGWVIPWARP